MKIKAPFVSALGIMLACLSSTVATPASAWAADPARSSAQQQLDRAMNLKPGGVQVSDNAVAWNGGAAVLVVPSDGEDAAPAGLGRNIRASKLTTPALKELAAGSSEGESASSSQTSDEVVALGSAGSCPGGVTVTDYYCFYQYRNYDGRRVQFTGATEFGYASNYGFNNGTSSWVSRDVDCVVSAYDGTSFQTAMWRQPENSTSSFVGTANNNKMSSWSCG